MAPRYGEDEARTAVAASRSWTEVLRRLGMCPTGGNAATLKRWAARWHLDVEHFDPYAGARGPRSSRRPLAELLVRESTASRKTIKARLYDEGLKARECEHCGQGEVWRGRWMGLVLDHVNGVSNDNRLENLRIVCPNCAATLETHCGRSNRVAREPRTCRKCAEAFVPRTAEQRYCSRDCAARMSHPGVAQPALRRVPRPPLGALRAEIERDGYSAVGRRLGVSDNAVRKWFRSAGEDPPRRRTRRAGAGAGSPEARRERV